MATMTADGSFSAELSFIPLFNLALQQNALPVVKELILNNDSGRDLENLQCRFSAVPEFIHEKTIQVSIIKKGEKLSLDKLEIELDYDLLSQLSERVKGQLLLEIIDDTQTTLFQKGFECEAFAPDQWHGMEIMPELLASFVTPNLEVISHLQSAVAEELERATGSSAIQGYDADKKRVYEICAAIYRAIHNWGIAYSNPPSSFGVGQRIRFADTIYQYKLGTCLDTTLLFASVMESCGLNPVIIVQQGHAYIGCHLQERYFPDIPLDDLQTIRKLADLDEFLEFMNLPKKIA